MSIRDKFPWLELPLIANAPMGGIAGPALAASVTKARGLGLMGLVDISANLYDWLDQAEKLLTQDAETSKRTSALPYIPVGVGFLLFMSKVETVAQIFRDRAARGKKPPALIWLFAANEPSLGAYIEWSTTLRKLFADLGGHVPQIWIQVGGSARSVIELSQSEASPDAIVVQGSDAGGHGMEKGASIVGLVPEVRDLLQQQRSSGFKTPHILASGGIVDARGVLAALSLGAEGVIMGTRFLASPETLVPHEEYRNRVLAAHDGAMSTIRAKVFDELKGPNAWPVTYDGRALVSKSWRELHEQGVAIETIREGHAEAARKEDGGYGIGSDRSVIWCGTGVGLVNEKRPAEAVLRGIRQEFARLFKRLDRRFRAQGAKL